MGATSAFKRYQNPVYLTCCSVICLFLFACQSTGLFPTGTSSIHSHEKKYLAVIREVVLNEDFTAAVRENQRILEYYSQTPGPHDMVLSNYVQNAKILSELLARILEDEKSKQALSMEITSNEEKIKVMTLSWGVFKKKADGMEKKLKGMDQLSGKVKTLEKEKKLLQQQINQLKEIDLNPVGTKPSTE